MPERINSLAVADRMEAAGFMLSCRSTYLSTRNWLQVCLMGDLSDGEIDAFLSHIEQDNPWA
jgi:hypothetical protein